ncbi:Broad specificity phosphatase PhoE [Fibrobacter sp. UWB15]|uniref:histidine phosphatase family protein n=1 Tax=unclassified Fibrobacter TaxID=2634177 RepID=UPI00090F4B8F|nr:MULTISPECIES: histidine phosphatase family protein [unclassified Fibrobacter]PWJ68032.1 broad specificity phosphatase PhoE [Fibrobacter sp. UWB6]SHF84999.1 Broad specificity phosphatase PhoE [Fibrobacter sp. UWB8]SMG17602.1 Broad specificity phosphatase PhoE [Fibrobacter sp. UWB15]
MKKKFITAALTAFTVMALFSACSESSSSSSTPVSPITSETDSTQVNPQQPDQPQVSPKDSTEATEPAPITNPVVDPISGDSTVTVLPTPEDTSAQQQPENPDTSTVTPPEPVVVACAEGEVPTPVDFPQNEFTDIGDVYKNIQCNEKVVFMIRHGERSRNYSGKEAPLTDDGIEEAIAMGAKLTGPGEFKFIHTGFVRTYQTALYAAVGRGQAQVLEDGTAVNFVADTVTQLTDGWFMKDKEKRDEYQAADSTLKNVNVMYAYWAYEGLYTDVFYDLEERSKELLNTYVLKDVASLPKYTLIASHDQLLMPLLVYLTNKQIDLKLHSPTPPRNWLTFLAGVAIIVNDKGELRYAPIKGGATGVE